jgi:hypothetical protein
MASGWEALNPDLVVEMGDFSKEQRGIYSADKVACGNYSLLYRLGGVVDEVKETSVLRCYQ